MSRMRAEAQRRPLVGDRLPGDRPQASPPSGRSRRTSTSLPRDPSRPRPAGRRRRPGVRRVHRGQGIVGHRQALGDAAAGDPLHGRVDPEQAAVGAEPALPVVRPLGDGAEGGRGRSASGRVPRASRGSCSRPGSSTRSLILASDIRPYPVVLDGPAGHAASVRWRTDGSPPRRSIRPILPSVAEMDNNHEMAEGVSRRARGGGGRDGRSLPVGAAVPGMATIGAWIPTTTDALLPPPLLYRRAYDLAVGPSPTRASARPDRTRPG